MTTRTITVLAHRKAEAVATLAKLAKKANRYGTEPITFEIGGAFTQVREYQDWDGETRRCKVTLHAITVHGSAPRLGNFELRARIEHTANGNLLHTVPGKDDVVTSERYRASKPTCEHCKVRRARNDTYVVLDRTTGQQLQVGANCLREYTGIDPAAAIAKCAFEIASRDADSDYGWGGCHWTQTLEYLLTATATSIRIEGWLSKSEAAKRDPDGAKGLTPTATRIAALWAWKPNKDEKETARRLTEKFLPEDRDLANKVIAWVREEAVANNDYIHNLKVACAEDIIYAPRWVGLACSAVAADNRAQEIETRKRAELQSRQNSKHIGTKGERLRDVKATILMARHIGENGYGQESVLYKFLTIDGNVLTWITTSEVEIAAGRAVVLTGTVKDHREYNGIAETRISRAKVEEIEDANHRVAIAA